MLQPSREGPSYAHHLPKPEDPSSLAGDTDVGSLSEQLSVLNAEASNHITKPAGSVYSGASVDHADLDAELQDISADVDKHQKDEDSQNKPVDGGVPQPEQTTVQDQEVPTSPAIPSDLTTTKADTTDQAVTADVDVAVDEGTAVQVEVTSIPASGQGPPHPHHRQSPLQVLTKSHTWSYVPEFEARGDDGTHQLGQEADTRVMTDIKLRTASAKYRHKDIFNGIFDPHESARSSKTTSRVERSAGRMLRQSTSGHPVRTSRKVTELFRGPPPIRTPPSIPTPYNPYGGRSPRGGNVYNKELEQHARKARSPRHYMEHVRELRQHGVPRSAPPVLTNTPDPELSGTLQVCRLPTREKTVTITTEPDFDGRPSILKTCESVEGINRDALDLDKQVTFGSTSDVLQPEISHNQTDAQIQPAELGQSSKQSSVPSTPASRQSLVRGGRPIASYQNVPDPDELSKAVQLQKEAAAAVDIQRIFRGYVARGAYKKLLGEERQQMEDEQRKKLNSQKMHREHVARTQAIYSRGQNGDDLAWQRDYKSIKDQKARERQYKMDTISRENAYNQHVSNSTISVIGPHVEIYQVYHPKKTGPSQREFNQCALMIQKHIRGWLVRRRLEKLKRKAAWSGCSFERMVKDYKSMLVRVQRQHGRERAKTPFTFKQMNEYMDLRRRYESVFEKKAFGGELELDELDQFFRECDLYPSQAELEEAVDVVFKGRGLKGRGLKKKEILDIVFYVYVPPAAELENTRTSTWMSPIIDGVEARRLIGSEMVEPAPLEVCAKLVIASKRERRERENRALREKMGRQESSDDSDEGEQRRQMKAKLKTVAITSMDARPPA